LNSVKEAEKKQEKKDENLNPDSHWSFGNNGGMGLELTGKNCTNEKSIKTNVSKSGVPKKIPKRNGSLSRPDPTSIVNQQTEPYLNQGNQMSLELNSQGLQQIPHRSGSSSRNDRSVIKANARNILNIMDDVRQIDQEIAKRVKVKKSSATQRVIQSSEQINITPNLSIVNTGNNSSSTQGTNNNSTQGTIRSSNR
jgi:hypothetical protein